MSGAPSRYGAVASIAGPAIFPASMRAFTFKSAYGFRRLVVRIVVTGRPKPDTAAAFAHAISGDNQSRFFQRSMLRLERSRVRVVKQWHVRMPTEARNHRDSPAPASRSCASRNRNASPLPQPPQSFPAQSQSSGLRAPPRPSRRSRAHARWRLPAPARSGTAGRRDRVGQRWSSTCPRAAGRRRQAHQRTTTQNASETSKDVDSTAETPIVDQPASRSRKRILSVSAKRQPSSIMVCIQCS